MFIADCALGVYLLWLVATKEFFLCLSLLKAFTRQSADLDGISRLGACRQVDYTGWGRIEQGSKSFQKGLSMFLYFFSGQ